MTIIIINIFRVGPFFLFLLSSFWTGFEWMIILWGWPGQVRCLTSDSELSSSASVGALSSLFLWLRGCAPPWLGPTLSAARDWVLTANFLDASGVSVGESHEQCWMKHELWILISQFLQSVRGSVNRMNHRLTSQLVGLLKWLNVLWQRQRVMNVLPELRNRSWGVLILFPAPVKR